MGCANAKPEVHTKKPPVKEPLNNNNTLQSSTLPNQELKNPPISVGKENINPAIESIQKKPSNLSDIQKNPYLTREQVREQISKQQNQIQISQQPPVQKASNNQTIINTSNNKRNSLQSNKKQQQEKSAGESPVKNETPNKQVQYGLNRKLSNGLDVIPERRAESELTKVHESQFLHGGEKRDTLRVQESIFSSGLPALNENCLVSNISKPSESPNKLISPSISHQKVENEPQAIKEQKPASEKKPPIVQKVQIQNIEHQSSVKKNYQYENINNVHQQSLVSNKTNQADKSSSVIGKQNNQLTTQEIKINVLNDINGHNETFDEGEFIIPTEQHYDCSCSFSINNLVIDLNKVVW